MGKLKKCKLIYNPYSGDKSFKYKLDNCMGIFQEAGYEVHPYRSIREGDITRHITEEMDEDYDVLVASGGDGTINIVVNAMMHRGLKMPLGILPSGTANDFATYLGFKAGDVEESCRTIVSTDPVSIDLGQVGDSYFINVCAGGLFSNVSQIVDKDMKNALGSLAYYIKGVEQLPDFHQVPFRITTSKEVIEDKLYLYMIMNSTGTGGFSKLSPEGSATDGQFELLAVRGCSILELPKIFLKILTGEHLTEKNVLYRKDSYFKIECLEEDFKIKESTLDGEVGPCMPFEVKVVPHAISVFGKFK